MRRTLMTDVVLGLLAAIFLCLTSLASAADWPTYQHDNRRSGITGERLAPPLVECWTFESPHPPAGGWAQPEEPDVWSYGVQRVGRVRYDDAFQVAAVAGSVYFASTAENKLYAIDASTGIVRWAHYTSAPARLAPTVWENKLYLGGDDGRVTCLDTADGRVVWRFQAAPTAEHVVGQGRLMSLWPVRSGVTVDRGIAYFSAGLFPAEGLYLFALDATDGRLLWRNDSFDAGGKASISPQGYLLASHDKLFLPSGRVSPAVFARADGRLLYRVENGWGLIGGDYAMLTDEHLYSGTQQVMAYDLQQGERLFSWFDGRRILVQQGTAYVVTGSEMLAVAVDRMADVAAEVDKLRKISWDNRNAMGAYRRARQELDSMEPDDSRRRRLEDEVKKNRPPYDAWAAERRRLDDYLAGACQWRTPCETWESLILAGDVLWAGGQGRLLAVEAGSGEKLWTGQITGAVRGLAVADGRLLVSTTTGAVHCFTADFQGPAKRLEHALSSPAQVDGFHQRVADRIVRETAFARGYALLLGDKRAGLAVALAQRTELTIRVVLDEPRDVAEARDVLDRAGLHGWRVSVERGSLASPAYPPYFANLIVSAEAFQGHPLSTPADELVRMLRPHGGVAYAGQPTDLDGTIESAKLLDPAALKRWLAALDDASATFGVDQGWVRIRRGPLPGEGRWSHQYADAGASGCSEDRLAKAPFGVLWFGEPGPRDVLERHARAPAPLSVDGRLFLLGRDVVLAHDAYNGVPLWRRELEGAKRQGLPTETSSMAASSDGLFVLVDDKCLRLDPATGQTLLTYVVPPRQDEKRRRWGWLAVVGKTLFGTRTENDRAFRGWPAPQNHTSEAVFAIDVEGGQVKWTHEGEGIMNVGVAVGRQAVFVVDRRVSDEQRRQAMNLVFHDSGDNRPRVDRKGEPLERDVRVVVALDAADGSVRWTRPLDVTDCVVGPESRPVAGGEISLIHKNGVVLLCSAPWNGHFLEEFQAGKFSRRSLIALDAASGDVLWSGWKGYRSRPLVIGDTIYAEPWAHDLRSGRQRTRPDPLSGTPRPWDMWRGYGGCGTLAASASTLFFRSGTLGYYDLIHEHGVIHFGAQRPGCWINFICAGGLLLMPEGSSECVCPFPIQCSLALYPRETNRGWGESSLWKPLMPVKRLAVNVGAPGDRRDKNGTLWLAWPRKGMIASDLSEWMPYWGPMERFYSHRSDVARIEGTPRPWVFTSGSTGLDELAFRLVGPDQPSAKYTVRLGFAEPDDLAPGERVFDVAIQGETVLERFDVVATSGGPRRAIVREFADVEVDDVLRIRITRSEESSGAAAVLCGIEAVRQ